MDRKWRNLSVGTESWRKVYDFKLFKLNKWWTI